VPHDFACLILSSAVPALQQVFCILTAKHQEPPRTKLFYRRLPSRILQITLFMLISSWNLKRSLC